MIPELLFLLLVLVSLLTFAAALVMMLRDRRPIAERLLGILGIGWLAYLSVVFLVSAATPQRVVPFNQNLCFDEMCFSVIQIRKVTHLGPPAHPVQANGIFYVVTVRVSNRSRGRTQSEGGIRALLWQAGRYYKVSSTGQSAWDEANGPTAKLTSRLRPDESIVSDQVFEVPASANDPGLVLSHGFTPGYFVIGECPLFHKPTILRLMP